MEFTIHADWARRRAVVTLGDHITVEMLLAVADALIERGLWTWPTIVDARASLMIDFSEADITRYGEALASRHRAHPPRGDVLIVAGPRSVANLVHSIEHLVPERHVVRSLADAHAWLDRQARD